MFQQSIALITLLLSFSLGIYSVLPALNHSYPLALGKELWPYLCLIPVFGFGFRLSHRSLRRQYLRLGIATLLAVLMATPWLQWVGMPKLGSHPDGLRVMSYNIWTQNSDYAAIQQSIQQENPDILFLTEINLSVMDEIKNRLDYPYHQHSKLGSNAIFSRYPLLSVTAEYPNVTDHGLNFSLVAQVQMPQELLTVIGIHPPIPLTRSSFAVRNQQFERIAPFIEKISNRVIVMGDFNTSPWSPYFSQFLQAADLSSVTQGQGIWATWSYESTFPHLLAKIPIDHIASRGFDGIEAWVGQANGSDHRPIVAVLRPV
ncbi:endonuclease/exonuclease/phosphatase family protein [Acaryochloris sp. IP29b_bin.137]|uniref:endonuclease/exonuclease/phosphatase family protein n=1 Tax=Acaryochloris sp. IP29b_bin.137 TaxID=2969217 RepID=UPI002619FDC4|nr:endonuclease/exonuclease/phosphatase family protein [Acaryochloris sp. IP29b_bin.137]